MPPMRPRSAGNSPSRASDEAGNDRRRARTRPGGWARPHERSGSRFAMSLGAQEFGHPWAGRLGVVGRERDVVGRGAGGE
jgi:hypothetical protein